MAGRHSGSGAAEQAPAAEMQGQWRPLLVALLVSIVAHLLVLGALHARRSDKADAPPKAIVFTATIRDVPFVASVPTAMPRDAAPNPRAPVPTALAARADTAPHITDATALPAASHPTEARARPTSPPPAVTAPSESPVNQVFLTEDQWTTPPLPQELPDAGVLGGTRVVGRRLAVRLWIDESGVVLRAEVAPYELSPQVAALLEQMVIGLRFAPASLEGQPVRAEVMSHLCFDDGGQIDTSSEGCWRFGSTPAR
ncbi:MAG: hypothetical protein ACHP7E_04915 [Burkholderiales bacterium]